MQHRMILMLFTKKSFGFTIHKNLIVALVEKYDNVYQRGYTSFGLVFQIYCY